MKFGDKMTVAELLSASKEDRELGLEIQRDFKITESKSADASKSISGKDRSQIEWEWDILLGKLAEFFCRIKAPEKYVKCNPENVERYLKDHPDYDKMFIKTSDNAQENWQYHDLIDINKKILVEVKAWDLDFAITTGIQKLEARRRKGDHFFATDVLLFHFKKPKVDEPKGDAVYEYQFRLKWDPTKYSVNDLGKYEISAGLNKKLLR